MDRQSFLSAIESNPYDFDTRKIFADWLEEYGDEEDVKLAVLQRAWTKEKQDAIQKLTNYAEEIGLTYEELIATVDRFVNNKMTYIPFYMESDFFDIYELATGEEVSDYFKFGDYIEAYMEDEDYEGCAC